MHIHTYMVKAPDRCLLLEQQYWERVVDEDLEHPSIPQPHEHPLSAGRTTNHLDVTDLRLKHPLPRNTKQEQMYKFKMYMCTCIVK